MILDGVQDGWVAGSLVALTRPGYVELYVIVASVDDGVAKYAVSGRATRLDLDSNENLVDVRGRLPARLGLRQERGAGLRRDADRRRR